jgi:hypothetical protein
MGICSRYPDTSALTVHRPIHSRHAGYKYVRAALQLPQEKHFTHCCGEL